MPFFSFRIDSEHKSVIRKIVKEISCDKFTRKQIEGNSGIMFSDLMLRFALDGVKIYRRSLRGSRKENPETVQQKVRIRSRQQRVREYVLGVLYMESV